jgi:hypothetical protein
MSGSDEEAQATLRKLMKSNDESLAVIEDPEQRANLELEQRTLADLLPKSLSVEEIIVALAPVKDAIVAAGNVGQATGVAMKQLKSAGAVVNGKDVSAAVTQVRQ